MKRSHSIVLIASTVLAFGAAVAAPPTTPASSFERPGDASKSWQIRFDRTAKSDGQITFQVWQSDEAAPIELVLPVTQGQTENSLALATKELFRDTLGVQDFDTDNKQDNVFVTAMHGERRFSIKVAENSAENVKVDLYGMQ